MQEVNEETVNKILLDIKALLRNKDNLGKFKLSFDTLQSLVQMTPQALGENEDNHVKTLHDIISYFNTFHKLLMERDYTYLKELDGACYMGGGNYNPFHLYSPTQAYRPQRIPTPTKEFERPTKFNSNNEETIKLATIVRIKSIQQGVGEDYV